MEIKMLQERIEKKQLQIAKIEKRIAKWESKKNVAGFLKDYGWNCNSLDDIVNNRKEWLMQDGMAEREASDEALRFTKNRYNEYLQDCDNEIRYANRDLDEAKETLKKYQESLAIEINKENAPKIEVLVNFLNQWRDKANAFYHDEAIRLYEAYNEHKLKDEAIKLIQDLKVRREESTKEYHRYNEVQKNFSPLLRNIRTYREPYLNEEELQKALDREVKAKYDDLVVRMKNAVREIQDCSNLRIGGNGSINGIISGTNGKARMETIMAGGWNIQCLHYRVLVNPIH